MRERHNVRIDPGDTDVEGAVLPDHEIEVDGQGTIRPLLHDGRRCTFDHTETLRDERGRRGRMARLYRALVAALS
jgi:hypothetical protein